MLAIPVWVVDSIVDALMLRVGKALLDRGIPQRCAAEFSR
jgi:hypothetical protein